MEQASSLLLKINDAAKQLSVSRRTLYALIKTNADIRACVVVIPGVRGQFLHAGRLRAAVDKLLTAA